MEAQRKTYTVEGVLQPVRYAMVTINAVGGPYQAYTPVYWDGKFKFKKLAPGGYLVTAYVPRIGEFRQTYSVGPGTADEKGRVKVQIFVHPSRASRLSTPKDRFTVPAKRLSIGDKAWREYFEAQKSLRKNEVAAAIERLNKAVAIAPQFAAAWNQLGTIAYQRSEWAAAEQHFREAYKQDDGLFEPIVNLGGVLLQTRQYEEARQFNEKAIQMRPRDALANSQLGLVYIGLRDYARAEQFLKEAKRLDPGHFSHPQLALSDIYLRQGRAGAAASELESFLRHHPDDAMADRYRAAIAKLRQETPSR